MSIDVNAIEQTVVVTAVGDEVNVNIIDQPVLVSVTDQIIEVEASGATGPQGPAGAGVAAGGTTGQVLSKASNTNYDTVWVNAGAGTVYSVDASGSTGISVTGGPITSTGTLTITNTLPDRVVGLTGAGTAVITGTYPNFTITTNDEFDGTVTSVNLTAGTGISVSGGPITGSGSISVTNTAPDQVVSLTGGGTTTISGTYPNFTISSTDSKVGTVTSVDMTVPTGLTISGNPITSAGTLALALASGYSIPTTASQANWNTAYNDSITSASVIGTSTKTLTLNQQDGGTVTASWSDIDTGLTSVGLSMPSAFAVANSPLTSNGTIAVTGAGTSAQYVRGDGQLANFPSTSGGGSSVNYYLNGSVNQGTFGGDTYYEMSKSPIAGAGTNFTRTSAQGNGYIASFITDANDPSLLVIPGGNWNLEFYFNASSGGGTPSFYAELYKVSSSNVFTLIASGSTNPEGITQGTVIDQYFTSIPVPQTSLLATDRIAVRIFVAPDGRNITLHTEDNNLCEVLTTFSTGLNALNGLTAQVQYFATGTSGTDFAISSATDTHTFNLPIASGTNTGKLSNTDWTTFINKQNAITLTTFNASGSATFVSSVLNIPTYTLVGLGGEPAITAGASTQYFRGDKTFQTLDTSVVPENTNLYYTDTRARNAITLTTTGSSGASTYSGGTLNIPIYSLSGLGGVPTTRTLTINGTTYDLSADRSWTIPVHDAVTIGTANGLSLSTQVLSLGLASSSANGALSSTDWSTFNGKQNAITLTTTGSSGAATLIGSTLNIPQYSGTNIYTADGTLAGNRTVTANGNSLTFLGGREEITDGQIGLRLQGSGTNKNIWLSLKNTNASGKDYIFYSQINGRLSIAQWDGVGGTDIYSATNTFTQITANATSFLFAKESNLLPGLWIGVAQGSQTLLNSTLIKNGNDTILSSNSLIRFYNGANDTGRVFASTGNWLIQTGGTFTDSGYKLDVNGTARVSSNLTASSFIKSGGTSSQYLMADGSTSTLTNPVTGTGTTNYLPKWTSGSAIGNSLAQDTGSSINIGTATTYPATKLVVGGASAVGGIVSEDTAGTGSFVRILGDATSGNLINYKNGTSLRFASSAADFTTFTEHARFSSGGNLLVNSTTDNGNRLQVTGNGYFSGNVGIGTSSATSKFDVVATGNDSIQFRTSTRTIGIGQVLGEASLYWGSTTALTFFSGSELMRLTPSGNLGLGVTPSAWDAGIKAFEIFSSGNAIVSSTSSQNIITTNARYVGGGWQYGSNGLASTYQQQSGVHTWNLAPSGTAGNAITFTQAMTLTSGGNLLVGTTTDSGEKLQVAGSAKVSSSENDYVGLSLLNTNNNASLATSTAIKLGFTSTVGTHYGTFKIKESSNNDNTADFTLSLPYAGVESTKLTIFSTGDAELTGTIKTGTPTGGTARPWKLGQYNATAPTATGYVEVEINGVLYKLIAAT